MPVHYMNSDIVKINVGGSVFMTLSSTLSRFPDTLLGNEKLRMEFWDANAGFYFFDRDSTYFNLILNYYRTGRLVPTSQTDSQLEMLLEDVKFYKLGIRACVSLLKSTGADLEYISKTHSTCRRYRTHTMLQGKGGKLGSLISLMRNVLLIVLVSIDLMILIDLGSNVNIDLTPPGNAEMVDMAFLIVDAVITLVLILDIAIQFAIYPVDLLPGNIIHIFSLVTVTVLSMVMVIVFTPPIHRLKDYLGIQIMMIVRLSLIVFVTLRNNLVIHVFSISMIYCAPQILSIFIVILIVGMIFGISVYAVEYKNEDTKIVTIAHGLYWSIITMTTVGYGDITPRTVSGKVVAIICACSGPIITAMIIPVVSNVYYSVYSERREANTIGENVDLIIGQIERFQLGYSEQPTNEQSVDHRSSDIENESASKRKKSIHHVSMDDNFVDLPKV